MLIPAYGQFQVSESIRKHVRKFRNIYYPAGFESRRLVVILAGGMMNALQGWQTNVATFLVCRW